MIKDIGFKIDKYGTVGLHAETQMKYNRSETAFERTYLRIETIVMFGQGYKLLDGMRAKNNIFDVTNEYTRSFYFPFLDVHFIGKAIVKLNSQYEILSMAVSEVDYGSFPIVNTLTEVMQTNENKNTVKGSVPVIWKPIPLTMDLQNAVQLFCRKFIY